RKSESVTLDDGSHADVWTEMLHLEGAEAMASYTDGPVPGVAAVTRNRFGDGTAWYLATRLDPAATARLVDRLLAETGVESPVAAVPGLEVVTRGDEEATFVFLLNHTMTDLEVALEGRELITGENVTDALPVPAGAVRVVRQTHH
ncbi:MAG: beta-galactosidase trimerization domain-containing protein, partial [Nocardioidaceae bacterium]